MELKTFMNVFNKRNSQKSLSDTFKIRKYEGSKMQIINKTTHKKILQYNKRLTKVFKKTMQDDTFLEYILFIVSMVFAFQSY